MDPLGMLQTLSFGGGFGGDAAPSSAFGAPTYLTMNSPFSVAGQGGKASSSASDGGDGMNMIIIALIVGAVVVAVLK